MVQSESELIAGGVVCLIGRRILRFFLDGDSDDMGRFYRCDHEQFEEGASVPRNRCSPRGSGTVIGPPSMGKKKLVRVRYDIDGEEEDLDAEACSSETIRSIAFS